MRDINENITKSMCYDVCARICADYRSIGCYAVDDENGHATIYTNNHLVHAEIVYGAVWGEPADMGEWRIIVSTDDKYAVRTKRIGAAYLNRLMFVDRIAGELEDIIETEMYEVANSL